MTLSTYDSADSRPEFDEWRDSIRYQIAAADNSPAPGDGRGGLANSASPLTPEMLHELFAYDRETGVLTWRHRPNGEGNTDLWNSCYAGKPAGCVTARNYIEINYNYKVYRAHRIVWAMEYGAWPEDQIDHINRCRSDNRIENLRQVNNSENCRNKGLRRNNKSGVSGVVWDGRKQRWVVTIGGGDKRLWVGTFKDKESAVFARKDAERRHGYHETYGSDAARTHLATVDGSVGGAASPNMRGPDVFAGNGPADNLLHSRGGSL